jgi:hypothetical protein
MARRRDKNLPKCIYCGSSKVQRRGRLKSGVPRFQCTQHGCERSFNADQVEERYNQDLGHRPSDHIQFDEKGNTATASGKLALNTDDKELAFSKFIEELAVDEEKWELYEKSAGKHRVSALWRDQDLKWTGSTDEEGKQIMSGHAKRKPEWHGVWNWTFRAKFRLRKPEDHFQEKAYEMFLEKVRTYAPAPFRIDLKPLGNEFALVLFLNDLHLGRLAWKEEVGENYDHKIALKNYERGFTTILRYVEHFNFEKIFFVINGDLFNYDYWGPAGPQTQHGTSVSSDERWQKLFALGVDVVSSSIDTLQSIAPTIVKPVPGNHDEHKIFHLNRELYLMYRNQPNVTVDNSLFARKYFTYGNQVIGVAHGQRERASDLHAIMFADYGHEMGKSKFQYYYLGHKHHEIHEVRRVTPKSKLLEQKIQRDEDYKGLMVTWCPNLAYRDHYEYNHGYVGTIRSMIAAIHQKRNGRAFLINHNLGA